MTNTMNETQLREEIVRIGRLLYERGLTVALDGNLSVRLSDELILTSPTGACKGFLQPDELVVVDLEGQIVSGGRPSSELPMHLHIYRRRPDAQAVIHADPPLAVACTLAGISPETPLLPEIILTLGRIPTAPYAMTGTRAMGDVIDELIAHHDAIVLDHHGTLAVGSNLWEAYLRTEQIEQAARILLAAHQHGTPQRLAPEAVRALLDLRRSRGGDPGAEPPIDAEA